MEDRIKRIFKDNLDAEVIGVTKINEGYSHDMFLVKFNKEPFEAIIRFSNNEEENEFNLSKEAWVQETLMKNNIPVPKIFFFEEEKGYMILENLKGRQLDKIWDSLSEEEKEEISFEMGNLAKKIHCIELKYFGNIMEGGKIGKVDGFSFKNALKQNKPNASLNHHMKIAFTHLAFFTINKVSSEENILEITEFLIKNQELLDYEGKPSLVHGDFHKGHIFVKKESNKWKIEGIIDFEFASSSAPEYEFIKLHREGFMEDKGSWKSFQEGYGRKIDVKKIMAYRITRDIGFATVLREVGNDKKVKEVIDNIRKLMKAIQND